MTDIQTRNEDEERKKCAKEFAEKLSNILSAKEIAMILWEKECSFCIFNQGCWGDVNSEKCATGVSTYIRTKLYRMNGGKENAISD